MSGWDPTRYRVPLGFVLAAIYLLRARPTPASLALGLPLAFCGLALRAASAGHIEKNARLTTSGPYRWTRNPLYLGSLLLAAGFLWVARDWLIAVLVAALLWGIYLPVIRREEGFLQSRFGAEFNAYCGAVPRFWPRRRSAAGLPGPAAVFSWRRYWRHREYNALLGYLLVTLALLVKMWWRIHGYMP